MFGKAMLKSQLLHSSPSQILKEQKKHLFVLSRYVVASLKDSCQILRFWLDSRVLLLTEGHTR